MSSVMTHDETFVKKPRRRQDSHLSIKDYTFRCELKTSMEICKDLNTPRSMTVWYLLSENSPESIQQLLSLPPVLRRDDVNWIVPLEGLSHETRSMIASYVRQMKVCSFADDYLVSEIMGKSPDLNSGIDRKAAAYDSFRQAEADCHDTNQRIMRWYKSDDPNLATVKRMRKVIARILGDLSHEKLRSVVDNCGFGPGATSAVKGADVLLSKKYASELHATPRLRPYLHTLMGVQWGTYPGTDLLVNDESRTTTVPKNAKTDRIIAIEPHMNIFVQKGIGALIRKRLGYFGVDLNTQSWNQYLASKAQAWHLATIDLKGASDSVSHRLVRYLLPWKWFELLQLARTDNTVCDGRRVPLEKFSSMGNGYTFELESLIFFAATVAVGSDPRLTAVYGDDIIVEKVKAEELINLLKLIGFKVNEKKTFLEGNFYESCGTDWYEGNDVRPPFLKGDYVDRTQCNLYIPNVLRRYAHRRGDSHYCDVRFKKAWWSAYRRLTPLERRTAIPDGSGDDGLTRNWDEASPFLWWSGDHQCWQGRVIPLMPVRSTRSDTNGMYLAALHKGPMRSDKVGEYPYENGRGQVLRSKKLRSRPIVRWVDLGPWA